MGKFSKVWITAIVAVIVAVVSLWWWQASIDSKSTVASVGTLNQTSEKGDNKKDCLKKTNKNQSICGVGAYKKFASDMKRCENKLNEQFRLKALGKATRRYPDLSYKACSNTASATLSAGMQSCDTAKVHKKNQCKRLK